MPIDWLGINWPETWLAVYALATVALVVVALVAGIPAWHQYRRDRLEGKYRILRDLSSTWESEQMVEARWRINQLGDSLSEELIRTYENNDRAYYTLIRVGLFFEDAASLGIAGMINLEDIRRLFGMPLIQHYFNLYRPFIIKLQSEQPDLFGNFNRLAEEETGR